MGRSARVEHAIATLVAVDFLRRKIWNKEDVKWWYAQNLLAFASQEGLSAHPVLKREHEVMGTAQLSLVHPGKYLTCIEWGIGLSHTLDEAWASKPVSD